jgi:hypothetical protein
MDVALLGRDRQQHKVSVDADKTVRLVQGIYASVCEIQ